MGNEPPIPIDPIHAIPQAVLRQTPMPNQANLPAELNTHKSPYAQPQQQQHATPRPGNMVMTSPPQNQQGQEAYQQPNQQSFSQAMTQQDPPSRIMPNIGRSNNQNYTPKNDNPDAPVSRVMPSMGNGPTEQPQIAQTAVLAQAIPVVLQPIGAPMAMQQAPPMQHRTPEPVPPTALGMASTVPVIPTALPPHPPHEADAYLDRAEHDPKVRQMLQGAQSKTIHTSQYAASEHPMTAQSFNKPLPTPGDGQGLQRAHTVAPGMMGSGRASRMGNMSQHGNGMGNGGGYKHRRNSLMSGLHAHSHTQSNLNGGDRYPAFPHQSNQHKGHSRQSSYNSVDPANIALPKSVIQYCLWYAQ